MRSKSQRAAQIAEAELMPHLLSGRVRAAARAVGAAFAAQLGPEYKNIGRFCSAFFAELSGVSPEDEAEFLSGFVSGFGSGGVLLVSNEGVERLEVYGHRRGEKWKPAPTDGSHGEPLQRIYTLEQGWAVVFPEGSIFKADLLGRSGGTAVAIKVTAAGYNIKSWDGGNWEREITVRGDKIY